MAACSDGGNTTPPGPTHTHDWSDWQSDATYHWEECVEDGTIQKKAAHTLSGWKTGAEATPEADGFRYKECTVCGRELEREVVQYIEPPHVHEWSEWECDESGHTRTCQKDGTVESGAHQSSDWVVKQDATEEAPGLSVKECTVCGYELNREIIPQLEKDWVKALSNTITSGVAVSLGNTPADYFSAGWGGSTVRNRGVTICGYLKTQATTIRDQYADRSNTFRDFAYIMQDRIANEYIGTTLSGALRVLGKTGTGAYNMPNWATKIRELITNGADAATFATILEAYQEAHYTEQRRKSNQSFNSDTLSSLCAELGITTSELSGVGGIINILTGLIINAMPAGAGSENERANLIQQFQNFSQAEAWENEAKLYYPDYF